MIVRVPIFAWCEDGRYIVYRLLERKFVSVLFSLDDEYGAHHLVCCRYVSEHWFADVWRGQDWVARQKGFYFF